MQLPLFSWCVLVGLHSCCSNEPVAGRVHRQQTELGTDVELGRHPTESTLVLVQFCKQKVRETIPGSSAGKLAVCLARLVPASVPDRSWPWGFEGWIS